jgi:hypothetical protein
MGKCRSCGAEIGWIRTKAGKNMPVDAKPIPFVEWLEGDTLVTEEGETFRAYPSVALPADAKDVKFAYRSHFATCPQADKWRNK